MYDNADTKPLRGGLGEWVDISTGFLLEDGAGDGDDDEVEAAASAVLDMVT